MSTLEQIVCGVAYLIVTLEIAGIIAFLIHVHRESHEKHDTAMEERKTLMERIAILEEGQNTIKRGIGHLQANVGETNNYIIFNHTRRRIVEQLDAYVTRDGGWKIIGDPPKIPPEFVAKEATVYVVLKDGEDAEIF